MYSCLLVLATMMAVPDGTLLFVEGGNEIVMAHTDSPYEATRPECRRIALDEYVKEINAANLSKDKNMKLWLCHPKNLSKEDAQKNETILRRANRQKVQNQKLYLWKTRKYYPLWRNDHESIDFWRNGNQ